MRKTQPNRVLTPVSIPPIRATEEGERLFIYLRDLRVDKLVRANSDSLFKISDTAEKARLREHTVLGVTMAEQVLSATMCRVDCFLPWKSWSNIEKIRHVLTCLNCIGVSVD